MKYGAVLILGGLIIAGVAAWLYYAANPTAPSELFSVSAGKDSTDAYATSSAAVEAVQKSISAAFASTADSHSYRDPDSGLAFAFPDGFTVGAFPSGEGKIIVLQDSAQSIGMQIAISAYDEADSSLTEARIKADLPDMEMTAVKEAAIAGGVPALAFISSGAGFGRSAELWFVHENRLYQMSTYLSQAPFLERVAASLSFPR